MWSPRHLRAPCCEYPSSVSSQRFERLSSPGLVRPCSMFLCSCGRSIFLCFYVLATALCFCVPADALYFYVSMFLRPLLCFGLFREVIFRTRRIPSRRSFPNPPLPGGAEPTLSSFPSLFSRLWRPRLGLAETRPEPENIPGAAEDPFRAYLLTGDGAHRL